MVSAFAIALLIFLPGTILLVYGIRLFCRQHAKDLKCLLGGWALFLCFFLSQTASSILPQSLEEKAVSVRLFAAGLAAVFAYLGTTRVLLRFFFHEEHSIVSLMSRSVLISLAYLIWMIIVSVIPWHVPAFLESKEDIDALWGLGRIIVPLILTYIIYDLMVGRIEKMKALEAKHSSDSKERVSEKYS